LFATPILKDLLTFYDGLGRLLETARPAQLLAPRDAFSSVARLQQDHQPAPPHALVAFVQLLPRPNFFHEDISGESPQPGEPQ